MDHPLTIMLFRALVVGLVLALLCTLGSLDFGLVVWPITATVLCVREYV